MSEPSHLDKIRKLLRLSRSANEHEARLALQRAFELATRHGVDIDALRADPELGGIVHEWFPMASRLSREWKMALDVVHEFFHVNVCVAPRRKQRVFVGRADAIAVAEYVAQFLVRRCRSECATFKQGELKARRRMTSGKRAGFISGFFWAISRHLRERLQQILAREESWALVLADEGTARKAHLDDLIESKPIKMKSKTVRRGSALVAGYMAGEDTQINTPLGGEVDGAMMPEGRLRLK